MIAIHDKNEGFSSDWISYCEEKGIAYKRVNCYDNNIIGELSDCSALMWHFHHASSKDLLFAKQLIFALQHSGKVVFPDFHTAWHFDDKLGQRYLLEALNIPTVTSYVFYDKTSALQWCKQAEYPKVFKLRRGSGSSQVRLVKTSKEAQKLVKKAFRKGFRQYNALPNFKERWRKYRLGLTGLYDVFKGALRFGYTTNFDRIAGNEKGYVYFQDFIPGNEFDIRIIVIDKKAFAIKRTVRRGDFRASGSGLINYSKDNFDNSIVSLSFDISEKLRSQSLAIDFLYDNGKPTVTEISYGYSKKVYRSCPGFWNRDMKWKEESFNPQEWMVDTVLKQIYKKQKHANL